MLTAADFAIKPGSVTVQVRGQDVKVCALTMKDRRLAQLSAGAMPVAPLKANPSKGSAAPLEPDQYDPEYRQKMNVWGTRVLLAEIAISVRWEPKSPGPDTAAVEPVETLRKACDEIEETLTEADVEAIAQAMASAELGGMSAGSGRENALKN